MSLNDTSTADGAQAAPDDQRQNFNIELAVPISVTSSPSSVGSRKFRDEDEEENNVYADSMSLSQPPPTAQDTVRKKKPAPALPPRTKPRPQSRKEDEPGMLPGATIDTAPNPNPSAIRRFFEKSNQSTVNCHSCGGQVYPTERVCLSEEVSYHKACFRCSVCSQHLTIKTFVRNPVDKSDVGVYCRKHVPRIVDAKYDETAIGIRGPLNAQRVLKKGQVDLSRHHFDARNLLMQRALKAANNNRKMMGVANYDDDEHRQTPDMPSEHSQNVDLRWTPKVGIEALHIKSAMDAQKHRASCTKNSLSKHHYLPDYVHRKQNEILKAQEELELVHRREEDALLQQFQQERNYEEHQVHKKIEMEWEDALEQLTEKYEKMLSKTKGSNRQAMMNRFEEEKIVLRQQMDEKLISVQRTATMRLRHKEQEETSAMIERHGRQMLELLWNKQREVENEIEQELLVNQTKQEVAAMSNDSSEGFAEEAPTGRMALSQEMSLVGQNAAAIAASRSHSGSSLSGEYDDATTMLVGSVMVEEQTEIVRVLNNIETASSAPPPPPHPPSCRKADLFIDSSVFAQLDNYVLQVAQTEPESFTKLVHKLMKPCLTDIEKARAIFRWITAKDLNVIDFSSMPASNQSDTPLGILRGIKMGVETYHTLFRRLCSYAGLNCVEIRGHSKSVGYEPGMHIEPGHFLNTWNAVLLDGDWRLVQCNWGARHLVLNKDTNGNQGDNVSQHTTTSKPEDSIRYQQDEHYFLTDPENFITEFWPFDPKWQLLADPVTLDEFEQLPFVRSVFFHYGMSFTDDVHAVLEADECGGAQVRISVDQNIASDIVFHYQLRFADRQLVSETGYRGIALERFVFQSINGNQVLYKVFVPAVTEYFLEVFANRLPQPQPGDNHSHRSGGSITGQPFRLKCACKFRIKCQKISQKMHPLPACSPGEWGPVKALRHFGLQAITHPLGAFDCADQVQIAFAVPKAVNDSTDDQNSRSSTSSLTPVYDLHARLHMNNVDDKQLEKFCTTWREHGNNSTDQLVVRLSFPQSGQYGVDIYARRQPDANFSHACKYLINVRSVARPDPSITTVASASPVAMSDKFGPTAAFSELNLKAISHRDTSTVILKSAKPVDIEFGFKKPLDFAFHFMRAATFEDLKSRCQMLGPREAGKGRVIFRLDVGESGHFLLAIYARRSESGSSNKPSMMAMSNVFNYHIICTAPPSKQTPPSNNFMMTTMSPHSSSDDGVSNGTGTPRSLNSPMPNKAPMQNRSAAVTVAR